MRQIVNDQKMNTLSLGLESVHSDRIFSNGSTKDSDTDLVDWLTDLNVGKEVIEKVKTFCSFLKQLKSVEMKTCLKWSGGGYLNFYFYRWVAVVTQLVEQLILKPEICGSSPVIAILFTINCNK